MAMTKKPSIVSFPMTFFMLTLILTVIGFSGLSWYVWKSSKDFELTEKRGFRLYELSSTISRVSEISTMSARMAVTTGDIVWEKYYRNLEIFLDNSINETSTLAPDLYLSREGIETRNTRAKLVEMENKAFDLVRSGSANKALKLEFQKHFKDAEDLLFSQDYEDLKNRYTKGITLINSITHERAKSAIRKQRMLGFWAFTSVIFAMPIFLIAWFGVVRKIRYYITRRNEAEEALMESERKYRNLVTETNEGFFISDKKGVITFANSAFARINGFEDPDELIGKPLLDFIDPEIRKKIAKFFLTGLEAGSLPKSIEARIFRKDGSEAFVQINPELYIEGRSIVGIRGVMLDITERKLAEEKMIINQEDLSVLNNISSVIGQTIDMKELCSKVLTSIKNLEMFNFEFQGGIFIIEGNKMNLVSHTGHSEYFINIHKDLGVGECLCGLAAETGKNIVSGNSAGDPDHTIKYIGMTSHGSIIVPLKVKDNVIGVLYVYTPVDYDMDKRNINLLASIGNHIGLALDNSRLYEETKKSSLNDPLTGIANRRMMQIIFNKNLKKAKMSKLPFSVIMIDIDHFKQYNDTKGHTAGDKVLVDVSRLLINTIRGADLAARYGGEEFIVMLNETDLKGAQIVAENIRRSVEKKTDVTVSLGVSCYTDDIQNEEELISKADSALYEAKKNGRNRVETRE